MFFRKIRYVAKTILSNRWLKYYFIKLQFSTSQMKNLQPSLFRCLVLFESEVFCDSQLAIPSPVKPEEDVARKSSDVSAGDVDIFEVQGQTHSSSLVSSSVTWPVAVVISVVMASTITVVGMLVIARACYIRVSLSRRPRDDVGSRDSRYLNVG